MPLVKCCALNSEEGPHIQILEQAGFEVQCKSEQTNLWDTDALIQELQGCCAIVAGAEPYPRKVIEAIPELRVIARTGVGYDAVDVAACNDRNVVLATTPGVNHHAVAEHTMGMLLALSRGFPGHDRRVRNGNWQRIPHPRLMGTSLGLVGLGRIGQAVATRAVGLGMNVMAFEPYPDMDFVDQWGIELLELEELLKRSNYVSLHNPLTSETQRMMNAERFALLPEGAVFINTARGGLVDEAALLEALQSGRVRAAGLDVFEREPLPMDSPFLQLENVLISPHVAGLDCESHRDTLTMVAETIVALRNGGWPAPCIRNNVHADTWRWERAANVS